MKRFRKDYDLTNKIFWISIGSVLYTYFVYPWLVWILANLRPKPKPYPIYTPQVTLLIAAYNEEAVISEKLTNCLALDYPKDRLQILVVTDGSTDQTPVLVQNFSKDNIKVLHEPKRSGKIAAINRAMEHAQGEVIVFSDANNLYPPQTLRELAAPFQDAQVGAASGSKKILHGDGSLGESEGLYWKYESFIKEQESRLGTCTGVSGEVLAIRRNLFQPAPEYIINDDFHIAMQVIHQGYKVVYVPTAVSLERVSLTAQDEIKRRQRIIAGRLQAISESRKLLESAHVLVVWQLISHKFLRPLVPFAMISAFLTNLIEVIKPTEDRKLKSGLFRLGKQQSRALFAMQILFYSFALLGSRFEKQKKNSRLMTILYLPTFFVNSNFAALKGIGHYLRGKQSNLWERIPRR